MVRMESSTGPHTQQYFPHVGRTLFPSSTSFLVSTNLCFTPTIALLCPVFLALLYLCFDLLERWWFQFVIFKFWGDLFGYIHHLLHGSHFLMSILHLLLLCFSVPFSPSLSGINLVYQFLLNYCSSLNEMIPYWFGNLQEVLRQKSPSCAPC